MCDSNELKRLDDGSLPMDTHSKAGRASFELEDAPEILITDLDDLRELHRIFRSAFKMSVEENRK